MCSSDLLESERVMGVEIAELCPALDLDDRTARLGASLVHEVALALMLVNEEESEAEEDAGGELEEGDADGESPR